MAIFFEELCTEEANSPTDINSTLPTYVLQHTISLEETLPASIFSGKPSGLQAIVKYLHEQKHYSFARIAKLLNRDPRTIWASYAHVRHLIIPLKESPLLPVHIFADRHASTLEHIVFQLKQQGLTFSAIARLLNKDPRTIWTAHNRLRKKEVQA
ncbi:MAG: hypothetical protein V1725_03710 [archaeon]